MPCALLTRIADDAALEPAYAWLCRRRADYPPDADVWSLRWRWAQEKAAIQSA
jgi:hypothetical protein